MGTYAGAVFLDTLFNYFKIGGPALFLRHQSAGGWNNSFINFDHTGWFPAPNYVDPPGDYDAENSLADPDNVHVEAKVIGFDGQILRFKMPAYSVGVVTVQISAGN